MNTLHRDLSAALANCEIRPAGREYDKKATGFEGSSYQHKLLTFFAWHGRKRGYEFSLAADMKAAGQFDDVVFQYTKPEDEKIYSTFVQAKHRNSHHKNITSNSLLIDKDDHFSLPMYFRSCQMIKQNPNFRNTEHQFVIFTNIGLNFENNSCSLRFRDQHLDFKLIRDDVLGYCYKFDLTDSTRAILTDFLIDTSEFKKLASALAQHWLGKEPIANVKLFQIYNAALREHVIDTKTKQFHKNFQHSNGQLSSNVDDFRTELKTRLESRSGSFSLRDDFIRPSDKLESFTSLPAKVTSDDVKVFLEQLVFAVDQPDVNTFEIRIQTDMKSVFPSIDAKLLMNNLEVELLRWMGGTGKIQFFSHIHIKNMFTTVFNKISQIKVNSFTSSYIHKLESVGLKLATTPISNLLSFLRMPPDGKSIFNLATARGETLLGSLIVAQVLRDSPEYCDGGSYIFIGVNDFKSLEQDITNSLTEQARLLVVECDMDVENTSGLLSKLPSILDLEGKRVVLISPQNEAIAQKHGINYELKDDFKFFSNLTKDSRAKLLLKTVTFQNKEVTLNGLLERSDRTSIDLTTVVKLIKGEEIQIGKPLPECHGYDEEHYVNRSFKHQIDIRREILRDNSINDLIAISGIHQDRLRGLLAEGENLSLFYDFNESDPSRFIVLESEEGGQQFQDLCKQCAEDGQSVHWLKYESGAFVWQQSKGFMSNLRKYMTSSEGQLYSELDILHQNNPQKFLIFSDVAGMGKTTVFSHFSKKAREIYNHKWVVRLDLISCYDELLKLKNSSTDLRQTEETKRFLSDKLKLKHSLEQSVLNDCFRSENRILVLLDGFDDICPDGEGIVMDLMHSLIDNNMCAVWVSTRPNLRETLEQNFNALAMSLVPFTENDQKRFLAKFWKKRLIQKERTVSSERETKLEEVGKKLLDVFSESVSDSESRIAGIPLHTKILAQFYSDMVVEFLQSGKESPEFTDKLELLDLYEQFVFERIRIYFTHQILRCFTADAPLDTVREALLKEVGKGARDRHKFSALPVVFNEDGVIILQNEVANDIDYICYTVEKTDSRIGLINGEEDKKARFIHRTFAEYFAATFLLERLIAGSQSDAFQKFMLTDVLVKTDYRVVRVFLDRGLTKIASALENRLSQYGKHMHDFQNSDRQTHSAEHFHDTILITARLEQNDNIFKFVKDSVERHAEVNVISNAPHISNFATYPVDMILESNVRIDV